MMFMMDLILPCFVIAIGSLSCIEAQNFSAEDLLYHTLFKDYNRKVRPIADPMQAPNVSMLFQISRIDELIEKYEQLITSGRYWAKWTDPRLSWDPEQYGGLKKLVVPPTDIWLPTFAVQNIIDDQFYDDHAFLWFKPRIQHTGVITWFPTRQFVTECHIDVTYYPFDDQVCTIVFENWFYTVEQVDLHPHELAESLFLQDYQENIAWEIIDTAIRRNLYNDTVDLYPRVTFILHMRRKVLYYIMNLVLPCVFISLLVMLVNKLPPDSGERISMGVTLLLSFAVLILMISEHIPATSETIPLIVIYLVMIEAMATMSVMNSVLVLSKHHYDGTQRPSRCLRKFIGYVAYLTGSKDYKAYSSPGFELSYQWKKRYRVDDSETHNTQDANDNHTSTMNNIDRNSENATTEHTIRRVSDILSHITQDTKDKRTTEDLREEWRAVAKVLDSFFFCINGILLLVITGGAFVVLPLLKPIPNIHDFHK